jgi:signal transduction histidine kinase
MYDNSSSILSQLKSLLVQLRPYGLQGDEEHRIALEQALRELIRQRQARGDAELSFQLQVDLKGIELPQRLSVAAYRIIQEAMNNVLKHADAQEVVINLVLTKKGYLELNFNDDGKGMDLKKVDQTKNFGILGMQERIQSLNGTFELISKKNQGTQILISVPFKKDKD